MQKKESTLNWFNVMFFAMVHILALQGITTFSWRALALAFGLWWLTGSLGIGLGFHRLLTHRGFKTYRWFRWFLACMGTLALQGSPIEWVGGHRLHHAYSDQENDPHNSRQGLWWAHAGWIFYRDPSTSLFDRYRKYTKDLVSDPGILFLHRWGLGLQVVLAFLLLAWGGWSFVVWGIFIRLVCLWHCTWLVNSAAHKFGYQSFDSGDESRNCWWVALLSFGEGWHNNHHAFPRSARHGMQWWEVDQNYLVIRALQAVGLVWDVQVQKHQPAVRSAPELGGVAA